MFSLIVAMAPGGPGKGNPLTSMLPFFIIFFAIFYFLIIRPQQKRQKNFQEMVSSLKEYDRVVTTGGIYGTIVSVKEASVILKIADNVKIEVNKANITSIISEKPGQTVQKK